MSKNTIETQSYYIHPNLEIEAYVLSFPKEWIQKFRIVQDAFGRDKKRLLKFKPFEQFLLTHDQRILYIESIENAWKDSTWIVTSHPIDTRNIFALYKTALRVMSENIKKPTKRQHLLNWVQKLKVDQIGPIQQQTITLTDSEGLISNSMAYQILPRLIYQQIIKQSLKIEGNLISFMLTENGVISAPHLLAYETKKNKHHYSLKIRANIQTTPANLKPMLVLKYSISRWMTMPLPRFSWNNAKTTIYKKIENQLIRLEVQKNTDNLFIWEPNSEQIYNEVYRGNILPSAEEVTQYPEQYPDFFVTYRLEFGNKGTFVGSGESMKDRYLLREALEPILSPYLEKIPPLDPVENTVLQLSFEKRTKLKEENIGIVQEVLSTAIGQKELAIEIYYSGETDLLPTIESLLKSILGVGKGRRENSHLNIEVSYHQANEIVSPLIDDKEEIIRHESKINQIEELLEPAEKVTACLILLPYLDGDGKLYFKENLDPKRAIRAGFAKTGRLTQFISTTSNKKDKEQRVKSAIADLWRQLGYIDPFNKTKKNQRVSFDIPMTAMHIMNRKNTPYGDTKKVFLAVTREANEGPVTVECPALWNGKKRYWEACLLLQEIATPEGILKVKSRKVVNDIKNKVYELYTITESPHILLVNSNGVSRREWGMITDSKLSTMEKKAPYTLHELWFENEKDILSIHENSQLRIVRIRINDEVPDYLAPLKENEDFESKSGIYSLNGVYYSLIGRPNNEEYKRAYRNDYSKILQQNPSQALKFTNLMEIYPVHLHEEDYPEDWVSIIHNYRSVVHQYKDHLKEPLLLHLAEKLEEYIY